MTSAVWEDCYGLGLLLYGNTVYNMGGDGFYIEAGVQGTVLQWNTVFDSGSGIGFRQNWGNVAFENYFFRNRRGIGIGTCDSCTPVKADAVMYNWLIDNGVGSAFGPSLSKEPAQIFDHNVYKFQDWPDVDFKDKKPVMPRTDKNIDVKWATNGNQPNGPARICTRTSASAGPAASRRKGRRVQVLQQARIQWFAPLHRRQAVVNNGGMHGTESKEKDGQLRAYGGRSQDQGRFLLMTASVAGLHRFLAAARRRQGRRSRKTRSSTRSRPAAELQPGLKAEYFDIAGADMPFNQQQARHSPIWGQAIHGPGKPARGGGAGNTRQGGRGLRSGAAGAGDVPRARHEEILEAGDHDRQPDDAAPGRFPGRPGLSLFLEKGEFPGSGALRLAGRRQRLERGRLRLFQRHPRRWHGVPAVAPGHEHQIGQRAL